MLECLPSHPNIVGFKRAWQEGQKLFIQTELCQGDLAKFLKNLIQTSSINEEIPYLQPDLIPEDLCWSVMIDIMQAARHLHRHKIVHLDIKPENVFTGIEDGRFKLGDFGIAFNFVDGNKNKAVEGDGRYAAPETFNLTSYTPKADSYSIGATVLQIAMGILHPRHARYQDTWADLKFRPEDWRKNFAEEMRGKSDELWETLRWLLASKPQERPSPEELLETREMQLRVLEREKQLARNRFKYRMNTVFNNVLQLLAILCPRHLLSKLRPLMRKRPLTPSQRSSMPQPPATPTLSFMDNRYRESLRSSSTPSRVHTPLIGVDEESLTGRVNLTERFTDMEESEDAGEQLPEDF
ncbi:membrane-associated tyrosine- and threonine-specific cdc2-inhibitory kinase wee-1.3 [Galendromus occidentalis]|uniref:non-specific serine/threonine protein kinase n=1 Tax=Galendromus occidentalis TaxID=34638 RepID=A0AAJ6QXD1_9ACAR|nr:membrane-associated tyrosine- and threonine-specific cdc2-inhibitory kinase wee-1.3 [Galendromus occidentalis]